MSKKTQIIKYSDFVSNYFYQQIAYLITIKLKNTSITPNQITFISLILGVISAISLILGYTYFSVLFLNISFILDCVDGQLARLKKLYSDFGMWLDNITDRITETSIIISLLFLHIDKCIYFTILLALNMLYNYMTDISIYLNFKYKKLSIIEKIIFSPIYFISRSMFVVMLSLLILFPSIYFICFLLFCFSIGIIFRIYRELNGRI